MMRILTKYRVTSSRVLISTFLTAVILLCQLLLFHYYYKSISSQYTGRQHPLESIYCDHGLLGGIQELAAQSDVELVFVDPDIADLGQNREQAKESNQQEFSFSKKSQESTHKSIVHLAAINETSGGQPNLKLFYEALKSNGYITLQYDSIQAMQPEVYRRSSHLFDGAHELHGDQGDEEVSKIYTEFIAHIFVLNRTILPEKNQDHYRCNKKLSNRQPRNTVIHIFVLYNYEYDPRNHWIQPALHMDELDKHKLLTYNVHWVDFRIPIEHHYLHPKRPTKTISILHEILSRYTEMIRVFEPNTDRVLSYSNNSFVYCKGSPFNISGLIDNRKRYGKYSMMLDAAKPQPEKGLKAQLQYQIDLAIQFMHTYSKVYGGFNHWLTGSSLLSYLKFCDLAILPGDDSTSSGIDSYNGSNHVPSVSLEMGVFASDFNQSILEGLANATNIGVKMISDWRKPGGVIHFKLADCPNVVFRIYPYELHKDFYQYYFITQNSMILNQKRTRKRSTNKVTMSEDGSINNWGHHVFGVHNLELCWTQVDGVSRMFQVPCNIHDHLRRIYIV